MISPWVSVWDQAPACLGSSTLPSQEAMATLSARRPEKLCGASEHSQYVEDKLCFIRRFFFSDKVLAVLEDQATRGQVIEMTEHETHQRHPDLVVASLGAQRKDKPGGAVQARVLFEGTHAYSREVILGDDLVVRIRVTGAHLKCARRARWSRCPGPKTTHVPRNVPRECSSRSD